MIENLQVLTMIFGAIAVFYAAKQVILLRKTHADNHEWQRRKSAQDATINLNKELSGMELLNTRFKLLNRTQPIPLDDILEAIKLEKKDCPIIQSEIFRLLNAYESLSRGVYYKVYNEELIRESREVVMTKTYRSFNE